MYIREIKIAHSKVAVPINNNPLILTVVKRMPKENHQLIQVNGDIRTCLDRDANPGR